MAIPPMTTPPRPTGRAGAVSPVSGPVVRESLVGAAGLVTQARARGFFRGNADAWHVRKDEARRFLGREDDLHVRSRARRLCLAERPYWLCSIGCSNRDPDA